MRFQRGTIKLVAAVLATALVAGGAFLLTRRLTQALTPQPAPMVPSPRAARGCGPLDVDQW